MAVLIEAVSVVVRVAALDRQFAGGWDAFKALIPSGTSCVDGQLIRLGFMTPADAESFAIALGQNGLTYLRDGQAVDLVIVDQQNGPTTPCNWIEFGTVTIRGSTVAACRMTGDETQLLFTPDGWQFEGSVSQTSAYVPTRAAAASAEDNGRGEAHRPPEMLSDRPPDAAELLAAEAEAWLNGRSTDGVVPRVFFGVTEHDQKFLLPLNTGLINQENRLQFLRWMCQRVTTYAYVTHVRRHRDNDAHQSTEEGVDIYASSMITDVTLALTIDRQSNGALGYRRDHFWSQPASDDPGAFAGLQRTRAEFDEREIEEFGEIWREIAPTVQWLEQ
jgi:hypothetical protein